MTPTGWTLPDEREDFGYLTLWDAVAGAVPDRECIVQGEHRQTWAQTQERSSRLGRWLVAQGLGLRASDDGSGTVDNWRSPNDLVGVLLRNCPQFLETTLACYRARCAPFNINYRYTADELAYLLDDAGASALVYGREFAPVVTAALEKSRTRPLLVHVEDGSTADVPDGSVDLESVLAHAADVALPTSSPDDVHVLYTGGTTGMPKGVLWCQREIAGGATGITVASPAEAAEAAPRRAWLRAFPAPPLMHGASLWFAYNAWSRGATLVLDPDTGSFDAGRALELMRRERVAWLAIIGDVFATPLLRALDGADSVPPDLSYVFSSGAALSDRSWHSLKRHYPKLAVINALGSSETGPQAFQTSGGAAAFSAGPNTVVVSEDCDRVLSADAPGVGWLSNGGTLPRGYLGDEERTTRTFRQIGGRRLAVSGDRAAVDADGVITFLGRAANVINTGGEKVYAEEVERVVGGSDAVAECLVLGRDSERWGQEVVALVVDAPGRHADESELRGHCAQRLAGYKIPKAFLRVDAIRRSPNGKPDYPWARETVARTEEASQ